MFWHEDDVDELRRTLTVEKNDLGNGIILGAGTHACWDAMEFYVDVDWSTLTSDSYNASFHWAVPSKGQDLLNHWMPHTFPDGDQGFMFLKDGDLVSPSLVPRCRLF